MATMTLALVRLCKTFNAGGLLRSQRSRNCTVRPFLPCPTIRLVSISIRLVSIIGTLSVQNIGRITNTDDWQIRPTM